MGGGYTNAGRDAFPFGAGESTYVVMRVRPGLDFIASDVVRAGQPKIRVEAYADDMLIGGMAYAINPNLKEGDGPGAEPPPQCADTAASLLSCIDLTHRKVSDLRVRKVSVDLLFNDCDC